MYKGSQGKPLKLVLLYKQYEREYCGWKNHKATNHEQSHLFLGSVRLTKCMSLKTQAPKRISENKINFCH